MERIKKIIVYNNGDSQDISTWSNVRIYCVKHLSIYHQSKKELYSGISSILELDSSNY